MKSLIALITCLVFGLCSFGQVEFQENYDFGSIAHQGEAYADIAFKNNSNKTVYFLRTEPEENVQILLESKSIPPGESKLIRVQINPRRKGNFSKKVEIWMSHETEPVTLKIKGKAAFVASSGNVPCPSFNASPTPQAINAVVEVLVVDSLSGTPLPFTYVDVFNSRGLSRSFRTKKEGNFQLQASPGLYGFQIKLPGYHEHLSQAYFSLSKKQHIIYLSPITEDETQPIAQTEPDLPEPIKTEVEQPETEEDYYSPGDVIHIDTAEPFIEVLEEPTLVVDSIPETQEEETVFVDEPIEPAVEIDSLDLPAAVFAPNNIVFLLDVSGSMAKREKLAIMQRSILALVDRLRPVDKISLITYADGVDVVLDGISASRKQEIESFVMSLKVGGVTEEEKGLRKAYQQAYRHKVEKGNNQVILITDGEFDPENNRKKALIFMGLQRGTKLSIVGIKASNYAKRALGEMCEQGGGNLVLSDDFTAAHYKLIKEIQKQSKLQ